MKQTFLATLLLLSLTGFAQKPLYNVDLYSFFDNREYNSKYNYSQTFFGTRLTPEVGLSVGDGQKIVAGTNLFLENGAKQFQNAPEVIFYYQYDAPKISANMGIFPRERMLGNFPSVFLYDSISTYDPNMSGMLIQRKGEHGYAEIGIDWNGYRTYTKRESFLILSSGKYNINSYYAGYNLSYFHYARVWNAPADQHLIDNGLVYLFAGMNLAKPQSNDSAYIQAGYLMGVERIRGIDNNHSPKGLLAEVYYKHKKIGVKNTLYLGDHQMNMYNQFGNNVYWGDPYFQSDVYNRTELFWNIAETKKTTVKLSSIHHFDGKVFGWQQMLTLRVKI